MCKYKHLLSNSCKTRRNAAKDEQKYQPIFLLVFSGSRVTKSEYTDTQRLNCRCQELDLAYLTVSLGVH